jgi:hypothetical protein
VRKNARRNDLPIVQATFPHLKMKFNFRAFHVGFVVYVAAMGYLILLTL